MHLYVLQVISFEEVGILQRLQHLPGVCKLLDYGMSPEGICLVMPKYHCSLRRWRNCHVPTSGPQQTRLYLNIFAQLVHLVQVDLTASHTPVYIVEVPVWRDPCTTLPGELTLACTCCRACQQYATVYNLRFGNGSSACINTMWYPLLGQ